MTAQNSQSPQAQEARDLLATSGVTSVDVDRRTPLHHAALAGDAKLVEQLLEAGAALDARDRWGDTPLHSAARRFRAEVLTVLIEHGASLDARNARGRTALLLLANHGGDGPEIEPLLLAAAQVLLDAGADPNLADTNDCTALQYAQARQHRPLAELIATYGGKPGSGTLGEPGTRDGYPTYAELEALLADTVATYPDLCRLVNIGQSHLGRDMWALKITDNPGIEEDEPEVMYTTTMHGDEIMGVALCVNLIDLLTSNYGSDPRLTNMVDEMEIWIMPCMNPDGYVSGTRYNAQGADLNRSFPDPFSSPNNTPDGRPTEVGVMMNWCWDHTFVLAASYHGGALLVNYPYDNNEGGNSVYTASPDDDLHIYISEEYSRYNSPMWNSPYFYHGISNGAAWYAIDGGIQDWVYRYEGGHTVTIEVSDDKNPPASQIPTFWNQNRDSMLAYLETSLIGVRGVVTDANSGAPVQAVIIADERESLTYTDPEVGDYHRLLLPGTYTIRVEADGYDPVIIPDVVVSAGDATRLDVQLGAPAQVVAPNGGETLPANQPTTVSWTGPNSAQFHVQCTYNAGDTASTTDDFEDGSLGSDYDTGGNANWYVAGGTAHGGNYAARAGNINDYGETWMTRTLSQGGDLSFFYKVSSEANYDYFNFYIDGDRKIHAAGEVNWTQYSTTLSPGSHELKWEYTKDVSWDGGSDTAWIDDLQLVDDNTVWTDIIALTGVGDTSTPWTPTTVSDSAKVRVRAYYGNDVFGTFDESDASFSVVEGNDCPGDLDGDNDVDQADLGILLAAYGNDAGGDIDGDGDTDQADLGALLGNYGANC